MKNKMHRYELEPTEAKLHDVLALLSEVHARNTEPDLILYTLRVCKHALSGMKQELTNSDDPNISIIAWNEREFPEKEHQEVKGHA